MNPAGWPAAAAALFLGLIAGSFANVVIYRIPEGKSVVKPGSQCPKCGHELTWFENIPIVSYVILRAKCKSCGAPISIQYPMVELAVGILWAAVTLAIGLQPELIAFLFMAAALVVISVIDFHTRKIPNKVLGPAAILAIALLVVAAVASGTARPLADALLGAAAYGLPMLGLALLAPGGMGMGDVKLAAYLGLHLGYLRPGTVAVGAFFGFLIGALAGIIMIGAGKKGRKDTLPFGPSMALGALVAVFWGSELLDLWLGV